MFKAIDTHLWWLCLLLAAGANASGTLNIYNWSDYIGATTLADFSTEFGVKVNYDVYNSSVVVDTKLLAGRSGYDIVFHAASNSAPLIPAGVYLPLDKSRLPNWQNLDAALLERLTEFDPDNRYGLPYMWGTTGFAYNRRMILERMPDAPLSRAELVFNPHVVSRFADCGVTLLDSATEVIGSVLAYLGFDPNSVDPQELKQAADVLRSVRPYIKYFDSTKLLLDLPSEEVCIAQSWSGDYSVAARRAREAGLDIDIGFNIPQDASLIWFDLAFIPADAGNVENAHLFLNYMLRPEVIAAISNFTGYANANPPSMPFVQADLASNPAIYPNETITRRSSVALTHPPKIERVRSRLWTRIKAGL